MTPDFFLVGTSYDIQERRKNTCLEFSFNQEHLLEAKAARILFSDTKIFLHLAWVTHQGLHYLSLPLDDYLMSHSCCNAKWTSPHRGVHLIMIWYEECPIWVYRTYYLVLTKWNLLTICLTKSYKSQLNNFDDQLNLTV